MNSKLPKYKDLLGTQLKFKRDAHKSPFDVFVAQIDYKKGITIKYLEPGTSVSNDENNAYCLNRELVTEQETFKRYRQYFVSLVEKIRSGGDIADWKEQANTTGIMARCAFK